MGGEGGREGEGGLAYHSLAQWCCRYNRLRSNYVIILSTVHGFAGLLKQSTHSLTGSGMVLAQLSEVWSH